MLQAQARCHSARITGKKVEGRKSHAELRPELVALVRQLRRRRPKAGQRSLWEISAELASRARITPHSALVFGPVGVHNAINGLVDLVEDEDAG
jgi:hypothetical protein